MQNLLYATLLSSSQSSMNVIIQFMSHVHQIYILCQFFLQLSLKQEEKNLTIWCEGMSEFANQIIGFSYFFNIDFVVAWCTFSGQKRTSLWIPQYSTLFKITIDSSWSVNISRMYFREPVIFSILPDQQVEHLFKSQSWQNNSAYMISKYLTSSRLASSTLTFARAKSWKQIIAISVTYQNNIV